MFHEILQTLLRNLFTCIYLYLSINELADKFNLYLIIYIKDIIPSIVGTNPKLNHALSYDQLVVRGHTFLNKHQTGPITEITTATYFVWRLYAIFRSLGQIIRHIVGLHLNH